MKRLVIKPKRITREKYALDQQARDSRKNIRKLEDILEDLDTTRDAFVRRAWKRCYHFQLTYSRVFRKWRKDPNFKKLVAWFKRQDFYPSEVNRIVNMMYVLDQRYGMDLVHDQTLKKAIFLAFMLEDDLSDRTKHIYLTKGYVPPKTPISKKQAVREFIARGFIDVDEYEDYNPDYNYVVCNIGSRRYYYPKKCFSSYSQLNGNGLLEVHVLQSLVGITGYTAVKYSINHKTQKNVRRRKAGNTVERRTKRRR